MRPADKLQALVKAYTEKTGRYSPKFIAMTERDYIELRDSVSAGTEPYDPKHYKGIPIVISKTEKETRCLP